MHEIVLRAPHPALGGLLSRYAEFSERADGPTGELEPASPNVVLVLDFAQGWRIAQGESDGHFGSFVGGLHDGPTWVEHPGRSHGVQLDLTPLGARTLLRMPLAELAHRVVDLDDVLGRDGSLLIERVASAPSSSARFALLDQALLGRAAMAQALRPDVAYAYRRLRATHGTLPIATLAAELGCSRRHLSSAFRAELGLGPKAYARILRFRHATQLLAAGTEPARVAAVCDYSDQPHLNREFRVLGGRTPVTFIQDERLPPRVASAA